MFNTAGFLQALQLKLFALSLNLFDTICLYSPGNKACFYYTNNTGLQVTGVDQERFMQITMFDCFNYFIHI